MSYGLLSQISLIISNKLKDKIYSHFIFGQFDPKQYKKLRLPLLLQNKSLLSKSTILLI